jgi:aspartate/methionine/tyrosine aminotransferase
MTATLAERVSQRSLIAARMSDLGTEGALTIGAEIARCVARGQDVVRLNMGEPDFDCPDHIVEATVAALRAGRSHYVDPSGIAPFRAALAAHIERTRGVRVAAERIVVTPGGKPPIGYSLLTYVEPGDEVIYPSPSFPIFESWTPFVGGVPMPLRLREENNFAIDPDELASLITPRTKLICLCSPSNPTGGALTRDELSAIASVIGLCANPDVRVYSDEIYEDILFDGRVHQSIISQDGMAERTILASGFSKSFAMTGFRLGYAVLPSAEEAEVFRKLNINTFNCVPPFVQEAGIVALEAPESAASVRRMVEVFEQRRDWLVPALNAVPGLRCHKPDGAFYVLPNVEGLCRSLGVLDAYASLSLDARAATSPNRLLQLFLLRRHGVATVDRASFGALGAEGEEFLRLSFASSLDRLREGVARIAAAARDEAGFTDFFENEVGPAAA